MPTYYRLGEVPPKRHTQFRKPDGGLYAEELFGEEGFAGVYSLLYHYYLPPAVAAVEALPPRRLDAADEPAQRHHHLRTSELPAGGDAVGGRQPLLFNDDIVIALVRPTEPMAYFFKNATADELFFVHEGSGTLRTQFGPLPFGPGDYLMVPRGTIYQFVFDTADNRLLVLEARGGITLPARYRNEYGQLLEHAPYWERDFRKPARLETVLEQGEYEVRVQVGERLTRLRQAHHPFDVVGWDGYLYPWAFNIHDFEPIAGRLHQPPTVHQTFAGDGFVVCSFCPRPLDWDPRAVPIPYYHSNLDCDEVIYYVAGTYRARRGIAPGSITWHPRGLPHGPQPGAIEASLGLRETDELAVMVDTFRPLRLARAAAPIDDATYTYSWQAAPAR
ncbi:MAG TPA: homogentisate 1,2-dioxygenase [Chloroflexota bacterium]|nr:homogentisate 1,2-dioxygenase [Chloroflexota bacterium]